MPAAAAWQGGDDISRSALSSLQHSCTCMPGGARSLHAGGCLAPRAFPAGCSQQEYLGHSGRPAPCRAIPQEDPGPDKRAFLQEPRTSPLTILSARSQRAEGWTPESGRLCLWGTDVYVRVSLRLHVSPWDVGRVRVLALPTKMGPAGRTAMCPWLLPCLAGAGGSGHRGQVGPTLAHGEDPGVPAGR